MHDPFAITLRQIDGYRFEIEFGIAGVPPLDVDEAAPLGTGAGPNPARLLAAAVGSCLAASLTFCLQKSKVDVSGLDVRVEGSFARNEKGRLRIEGLSVALHPHVSAETRGRVERCTGLFEDFCTVTQSVRDGLDVAVRVEPTWVEQEMTASLP
jgi:uncharacterized OsmC-like protein